MKTLRLLLMLCVSTSASSARAEAPPAFPLDAERILFLGDSITHAGGYIAYVEAELRLQGLSPRPELINLGLSSETCTGLSEPDHPFPRPDVHERIDRALKKLKPDVVVACYGMNDGIYYPFAEDRFKEYQAGIRSIVEKAHAAGAKAIILTPPPFDSHPVKEKTRPAGAEEYAYYAPFEGYDNVLSRYSDWLQQSKIGAEMVIDLHTPLNAYTQAERKKDSDFTLAPDGVHCNRVGHRMIADQILSAWNISSRSEIPDQLFDLIHHKQRILHDAYLSDVGHKRPSVKPGLPVEEAKNKAAELDEQIRTLVEQERQTKTSQRKSHQGTIYQAHYPADLTPGALRISVDYYLWIPDGVETVRGVIVHQHGCGVGASVGGQTAADDLQWQALAAKWDCALLGSSYEPREGINCRLWCDPRNGSGARFLQALGDFSDLAGHRELETAPWCLWGHSGGGFWSSLMQVEHPERIVAIWFRSGTAFGYWTKGDIEVPNIPDAAYRIPMMANPGVKERDHERFQAAWTGLLAMQKAYQEQGATFFEFAADPNTSHECGGSRFLAIPFFDFWLEHRLPTDPADQLRPAVAALDQWHGEMSRRLEGYLHAGLADDRTPPPPPANVRGQRNDDQSLTLTWTATADLESGLKGFVIEHDGEPIAALPETPQATFGHYLFQGISYHDTPNAPLAEMTVTIPDADAAESYSVRAVNTCDLKSEASVCTP
ncbi:SGNH/GDSL hydrolase family protein [Rubinisphaera margarita]|uniref:SGNH/GDSL hydrolase family protein n=1 Tax=Rubinisphaera margarita TaxID=2909586 RepID=UPI001EE7CEA4|nr:SGNH/GDSL hydrolase family protein [Rubinisphaera margarita]MCG6156068.1 SGNH/GDSL hydrolase family protein [Rubinisphaera margarita]